MDYSSLEYYDYTNVTDLERVVANLEQQLRTVNIPAKWIGSKHYGIEEHNLTAQLRNTEMKFVHFEFHHHGPYVPSLYSLYLLCSLFIRVTSLFSYFIRWCSFCSQNYCNSF